MATTPGEQKKTTYSELTETYYDASKETKEYDATPDSGIHDLSNVAPEHRAKLEEEWKEELAKTEEEIITLRQVLASKVRYAQDLKHKLGITVWKEFKDDMEQGIKNIQETDVYQRTSQTLKTAGEKTTNVLGNLGASVTKKLGEVKNSQTFRSFEEKVGTAYESVKNKIPGSRSTGADNFEEALNEKENPTSGSFTPATPEGNPLP
ncbi:tumor protein D52-like [Limulus polyphemus]|uniref:Tumor protein D52-like n=1 Tax=Limulus polyphemus TaxID=6850 RepID=A0ABM1BC64_LIMPO|nr:tumor protein D52-like [Limulus polyphemus]